MLTVYWTQRVQQELEEKKKMESQSQEEKQQSPSPNKAGVHKVFFYLCAIWWISYVYSTCYSLTSIEQMFLLFYQGPAMPKMPQMDLIAELKKRQKPQVREGKDGALEDIITGNVVHFF